MSLAKTHAFIFFVFYCWRHVYCQDTSCKTLFLQWYFEFANWVRPEQKAMHPSLPKITKTFIEHPRYMSAPLPRVQWLHLVSNFQKVSTSEGRLGSTSPSNTSYYGTHDVDIGYDWLDWWLTCSCGPQWIIIVHDFVQRFAHQNGSNTIKLSKLFNLWRRGHPHNPCAAHRPIGCQRSCSGQL